MTGALPSVLWRAVVCAARQFLPSWLVGIESPGSHGSSRWASTSERKRLGWVAAPEQLAGGVMVLGFFGRRVIQSPRENNALLLAAQRSGTTSTVVRPT